MITLMAWLQGKPRTEVVAEWHATVQGFCEVVCPWPPFRKVLAEDLAQEIKTEHHYYMAGRALGIMAWIGIAKLIEVIFGG